MLFKILIALFIALPAQAKISCEITEALANPNLANNQKFWSQLNELSRTNKYNEENLKKLLKEHGLIISDPKPLTMVKESTTFLSSNQAYTVSGNAGKQIEKLPTNLRNKFEEFLQTLGPSGEASLKNFRDQPGRWNLKKPEMYGINSNVHTVRLNHGYRVAFRPTKDGIIEILEVSKDVTH